MVLIIVVELNQTMYHKFPGKTFSSSRKFRRMSHYPRNAHIFIHLCFVGQLPERGSEFDSSDQAESIDVS